MKPEPQHTSRVLVVEDDAGMREMLSRGLGEEGFRVDSVGDGERALQTLLQRAHDVCVLDVLLPVRDGFDALAKARAGGVQTPILVLTAKDSVPDRVRGLELGADDYLVKPFAFAELCARIRVLLRRHEPHKEKKTILRAGDVVVDVAGHHVERAGVAVELSPRQFALLEALLRRKGEVVSRRVLLEEVFGYSFDTGTNIVDVHVAHLRKRLERPLLIETVRGVGYRIPEHHSGDAAS